MTGGRKLLSLAAAALAAAVTACTSLPDTSGYTKATSELSSAIASAGDITHEQLVAAAADLEADARANATTDANTFRQAWNRTSEASQKMVEYAESIEAITASASEARGDIDSVAASLGGLATAAGIANPLVSETGGIVVGIAREVWAQVRIAQAARDLETSLAAADPAVQRITIHLQEQLADLRRLWNASMDQRENRLLLRYGNVAEAYPRLSSDYGDLISEYAAASGSGRTEIGQRIEAMRPQFESAREIAEQYERERAQLTAKRDNGMRLIAATISALESWRRAHERLKTAIEQREPVSVQSLVAAAERVRAAVQDARDEE